MERITLYGDDTKITINPDGSFSGHGKSGRASSTFNNVKCGGRAILGAISANTDVSRPQRAMQVPPPVIPMPVEQNFRMFHEIPAITAPPVVPVPVEPSKKQEHVVVRNVKLDGNLKANAVSTTGSASVVAENVVVDGDFDGSATSYAGAPATVNISGGVSASGSVNTSAISLGSGDEAKLAAIAALLS